MVMLTRPFLNGLIAPVYSLLGLYQSLWWGMD